MPWRARFDPAFSNDNDTTMLTEGQHNWWAGPTVASVPRISCVVCLIAIRSCCSTVFYTAVRTKPWRIKTSPFSAIPDEPIVPGVLIGEAMAQTTAFIEDGTEAFGTVAF